MFDEEIVSFGASNGASIPNVLPLLDHLSQLHPDLAPAEVVAQTDVAIDRLYRARRLTFAGHRWLLTDPPPAVAGYLMRCLAELHFDTTTRTWSRPGTTPDQRTDNIHVWPSALA